MKKTLLSTFIILGTIGLIFGQAGDSEKFYFKKHQPSILSEKVDPALIPDHHLGDDIAFKMYVLKVMYTYILTDGTGINKTMVRKPAIFHSLKKMDSNYKRKIKKGEISKNEVMQKFDRFLDVGIAIFAQETESFETALRQSKNQSSIEDTFARVVLQ